MNKKILIIVGLVVVVAIISGLYFFGNKQLNDTSGKEPLKIGLNVWIGEGLYYVAQEKGFFDKEGVKVELINFDDGANAKQLINTNKIDAVYVTGESIVILNEAGSKVKAIAMNDTSFGADGIVASKEIKTIKDLKGKKVAVEIGNASNFLLAYFLKQNGMSMNDIEVVNSAAPDAGAAFVAGKVDAAVTWEPWLSKAKEREGGHILVSTKDQDSQIMGVMPVFRQEVLDTRKDDVKKMLRALFEARTWILANSDEANKMIAPHFEITPEEVAQQRQTFKWLSYEDNKNEFLDGKFGVKNTIQLAGDIWYENGLIQQPIDVNQVIDYSLIQNLYE